MQPATLASVTNTLHTAVYVKAYASVCAMFCANVCAMFKPFASTSFMPCMLCVLPAGPSGGRGGGSAVKMSVGLQGAERGLKGESGLGEGTVLVWLLSAKFDVDQGLGSASAACY